MQYHIDISEDNFCNTVYIIQPKCHTLVKMDSEDGLLQTETRL
jgi:hypothetical protein